MPLYQLKDDEGGPCTDLIFIPPELPGILKAYCKGAIRTQPYDLLRWSAVYFRALANGRSPPVKDRLELLPFTGSTTGNTGVEANPLLTLGYVRLFVRDLGQDPTLRVSRRLLAHKWFELSLPHSSLDLILHILALGHGQQLYRYSWLRTVAVAVGTLSPTLTHTMATLCDLFAPPNDDTCDEDNNHPPPLGIPIDQFIDLYTFLAYLDLGPSQKEDSTQMLPDETDSVTHIPQTSSALNVMLDEDGEVGETGNDLLLITGESASTITDRRNEESNDNLNRLHIRGIGAAVSKEQIEKVENFVKFWADQQQGMVLARNLRHCRCPPLDHVTGRRLVKTLIEDDETSQSGFKIAD